MKILMRSGIIIAALVVLMAGSSVAAENIGLEAGSGANSAVGVQLAQAATGAMQPSNEAPASNANAPGQPVSPAMPSGSAGSPGSLGASPYGQPLGGTTNQTAVETQPRLGQQPSAPSPYGQGQPAFGYPDPAQPYGVYSQPLGAASAPGFASQNLGASGALGPLTPPARADLKAPR